MTDELQLLADRLAIRQVMDIYGMAVDRRDWGLYRDVFTEDAIIDYSDSGGRRHNVESTVEFLQAELTMFAGLHHNMTNHVCEIDGNTARACTYFLAYHTRPDGRGEESIMKMGGFYQDRLRKDTKWRIAERVELGVWTEGAYPEGYAKPAWHGTDNHWKPALAER
jgi:ketosteroid isomerase-like protein